MPEFTNRDGFHLNAAVGWLELGNPTEALAELDQISVGVQSLPDVQSVRWSILARMERWDSCLAVATQLIESAPDQPFAWVHRAYALRRATGGGLEQAFQALQPAADKFQTEPVIQFNLACYAAQLGRLEEAKKWLESAQSIAARLETSEELKTMALGESDLEPLWQAYGKASFFPSPRRSSDPQK